MDHEGLLLIAEEWAALYLFAQTPHPGVVYAIPGDEP